MYLSYTRRYVCSALLIGFLAACQPTLIDEEVSEGLAFSDIDVSTTELSVKGRSVALTASRVQTDVSTAVTRELSEGSEGTRDVDVQIDVTLVQLVSPGQSFLIGGTSSISGTIRVVDSNSGEVILETTEVRGTSKEGYAPGGIIGAIASASKTPEDDYLATVRGFAQDVRRQLTGK